MNKKEKRDLQINWVLVGMAAMLSFFVNIAANSFYDLVFKGGSIKNLLFPFILFSFLSIFIVGLFSYMFERVEELKDDSKTLWYFMWNYIKSWRK